MKTMEKQTTLIDSSGDELRVEMDPEGRVYLTASQEECTATVGPFRKGAIEEILTLAEAVR